MSRYRRLFTNHFPSRLPAGRFAAQSAIHHPAQLKPRSISPALSGELRHRPHGRRLHDIKMAAQAVWLQASLVQTRLAGDIERSHMRESINFDRAAGTYDATRKLPDATSAEITDAVLREIRASGADRMLEVGIGTGRMARPLMAAGVRMVGVDISKQMMTRLLGQLTPEHTPPDLLLGDATALPLGDGSIRAAMVVHVLHLVASIQAAVLEIRRVLAPGGVLLQQTRRPEPGTDSLWRELNSKWDELFERRGFKRRHRPQPPDIRKAILATGAKLRVFDVGQLSHRHTVAGDLEDVRERRHSWMWEIPDELFDACSPEYEAWAIERYGSLQAEHVDEQTYEIEVWTWD
jgi:ubiquinone/menaquinone biosynthesis C-methylase UbiE